MDGLFSFLKSFDFEKMLPEMGAYVFGLKFWAWVLLMVGPVMLLAMGIHYGKQPAFDPNNPWAYANRRARKDRKVWDKAHSLAGKSFTSLGGILCGVGIAFGIVFFFVDALIAAILAVLMLVVELVLILISRGSINKKLR